MTRSQSLHCKHMSLREGPNLRNHHFKKHRNRLAHTFMRRIRRQRRHSMVKRCPQAHRPSVGGEQASCLLPCNTGHLLVLFEDVHALPRNCMAINLYHFKKHLGSKIASDRFSNWAPPCGWPAAGLSPWMTKLPSQHFKNPWPINSRLQSCSKQPNK